MKPSASSEESEDELPKPKRIYLFGKNIFEIKCFRKSFICGLCCGVIGGLACFLGTSKVVFSTHIGFISIWLGVYGYWFPCRYKYETDQFIIKEMFRNRKDVIKINRVSIEDETSE